MTPSQDYTLPATRLSRLGVPFPFFIAPMVGISHVAFRELVRSYLPVGLEPLLFTEMLSTRRIPSQRLDTTEFLRSAPGERRFIPQLLGNEERFITPSVRKLEQLCPWGFDINMGCPASQTLKHNWGVLLMGDRRYAAEVVRIARGSTSLPLSVKLRSGNAATHDVAYLKEFTAALEEAGADWLTVHARPRLAGHSGAAAWDVVGEVAQARTIPVVANGDIQTADDALDLMRAYPVDGAMIARAATVRPWILWQIAHRLGMRDAPAGREGELPPQSLEQESREYFRACLRLADLLILYYGDSAGALKRLQFFITTGTRWFFFGHAFWRAMQRAKSVADAASLIQRYADTHAHPMVARASLTG